MVVFRSWAVCIHRQRAWAASPEVPACWPYPTSSNLLSEWVYFNDVLFKSRYIRDVVVSPLPFFFLQFDGDSTHWAFLDSLHQMCDKPSDFIPKLFAWNNGNFFTYPLVGVEIQSQTRIVLLDDYSRGF